MILSKVPLSEAQVKAAIDPTGYEVTSFACADYVKKPGFFARLFGGGCC